MKKKKKTTLWLQSLPLYVWMKSLSGHVRLSELHQNENYLGSDVSHQRVGEFNQNEKSHS